MVYKEDTKNMDVNNDIYLLEHDPQQLVNKYTAIIDKWMVQYQQKGWLQLTYLSKKQAIQETKDNLLTLLLGLKKPVKTKVTIYGFLVKKVKNLVDKLCDKEDISILRSKTPNDIVMKYQALITKETQVYQSRGSFKGYDTMEIVQEMNEVLLRRIVPKLLQFDSKALFRTYFKTIIKNLLHETHNRLQRDKVKREATMDYGDVRTLTVDMDKQPATAVFMNNSLEQAEAWKKQQYLYQLALRMHPTKKRKEFELCLKVNYRILLMAKDIFDYWVNCPDETIVEILSHFSIEYQDMNKGELFTILASFISLYEQKEVKPNTLQKRFTLLKNQLLTTMFKRLGLKAAQQFSMADFLYFYYR